MRIILLRHATAVQRGTVGIPDSQRALLPEGTREASRAGKALKRMAVVPSAVVTSPYIRALDTARLAAAELDAPVVEDRALEPGFGADDLAAVAARHGDECLVLVGHDPDFSDLVGSLTGARVTMPKGGVARIDSTGEPLAGACELRWFLRPKQLKLIARGA